LRRQSEEPEKEIGIQTVEYAVKEDVGTPAHKALYERINPGKHYRQREKTLNILL
jgi:hypothetical protein